MNNFINDEKISISKQEYENLKMYENEFVDFEISDFVLKITKGAVIPKTNPNYNNNRIDIKIINQEKHSIFIDGKEYAIKSIQLYNKIKKFVSDNLNVLINWSARQNKFNLDNNCYEGGVSRSIKVKYGNLIIIVNGQVSDIGNLCDQFIEEIKQLIINEGDKTSEDYMMKLFEKSEPQEPTPLDEEFDKYCKLYEEKFGNKVTIPEPSGTKEFVIECIKKCFQENKDILGDLCYPNFKKDMENGVLYSETKNDLNNDKFEAKSTDKNIKTIIDEVIRDNAENIDNEDIYLNTIVYDIVKKIIDLPYENVTTIANLINYNPSEKFIEPIMQGRISFLVDKTCEKLNIELEHNRDKIGGLAYYNEFVKLNNDRF